MEEQKLVEAEKRKQANSARSARRRQAKLDAAKGIKRSRGGQVRPAEQIKSGSLRWRVYRRVEAAAAAAATAVEDLASTEPKVVLRKNSEPPTEPTRVQCLFKTTHRLFKNMGQHLLHNASKTRAQEGGVAWDAFCTTRSFANMANLQTTTPVSTASVFDIVKDGRRVDSSMGRVGARCEELAEE